jgi:Pentapeptide repeats (8 copies)
MRVRLHRKRPEPWSSRRQQLKSRWTIPLWAFEWFWEWVAYVLSNWSFLEALEYLSSFGVLIAVLFYFAESGDRIKQKHYQAWQVINTAQGKGGSGGRIEALQELNLDHVPIVGVDASGAFLQGVQLSKANLLRCDLHAADLRESNLQAGDLEYANLMSANLRGADLRGSNLMAAILEDADLMNADLSGADLTAANLTNADLRNTDLKNIRWQKIKSIDQANIYGIRNAPQGFLAWALEHKAISTRPEDE